METALDLYDISCNKMCLLSEWDENKPRDCSTCLGNPSRKDAVLSPEQKEQKEEQDKKKPVASTST